MIMSNLFWLPKAQAARLRPFFPKSHGHPRVDDLRDLSGIIFTNRDETRWSTHRENMDPQQDRDHIRQAQGLAKCRHALRQMPEGLSLRYPYTCDSPLLDQF